RCVCLCVCLYPLGNREIIVVYFYCCVLWFYAVFNFPLFIFNCLIVIFCRHYCFWFLCCRFCWFWFIFCCCLMNWFCCSRFCRCQFCYCWFLGSTGSSMCFCCCYFFLIGSARVFHRYG